MSTYMKPYLLVAAIKFGNKHSSYAFSLRYEYEKDPFRISTNTWNAGPRGLLFKKAPTCALFDPIKRFHSFGYEAEEKYTDLASDGEAHNWYYFRRFKMTLDDKMTLKGNFELESDDGKTLPAMSVFSSCIKYLVDHLFENFQHCSSGIDRTDIRWVLTVPVIWNDAAKQFMRKAAEKAEIPGDQLLIAPEPEAASTFCKHLSIKRLSGTEGSIQPFQLGSKYIVLDARGDTFYITVHEVMNGGVLKELHRANGGDWGGTKVDKAFFDLLTDIVGIDVMKEVEQEDKLDLLDLSREFKVKKRNFKPNMEGRITFKVPIAFAEVCKKKRRKEINKIIASKDKYKNRISWNEDKLRIEPDVVTEFFQESCTAIVEHLENLFREPKFQNIPTIFMVGGYSESPILQHFVKTKFKQKKIVVPSDPGLAVLIGAVIYGHEFDVQDLLANPDEDDVSSDDIANQSTCSSSSEQCIHNDQIGNLKYESLSEEGEDFLSSDYLEMNMQRQDKRTLALENQLKNQMTLKYDITRAPSDDELFALSRKLDKLNKGWWLLAKLLGLSDKQIGEIEHGGGETVRQYYTILTAWKSHNAGQEKGSVGYLLRQCDEAGIDREVTDPVFGN